MMRPISIDSDKQVETLKSIFKERKPAPSPFDYAAQYERYR